MNAIRSVLIVGGGSSGWMAAALLRERIPSLEISLIESSDIPTLGVGESTNAVIAYFHKVAGIDERAFMTATQAAFKHAVRFDDFAAKGLTYFHPFGRPEEADAAWCRPDAQTQYPCFHVATRETYFCPGRTYSYQLDAGLYGQFLKEHCKRRQVRHIVDTVSRVAMTEDGSIDSIHTASGQVLKADLYVDCSGFRSTLLGQALKEPFHPVNRYLLNDRAIAVRLPFVNKAEELKTFTTCTGLNCGWVWQIPLWSRRGTGYVYSSAFASESEAEDEFRNFLGRGRVRDATFNHIKMRTGRYERAWVKNCVGIGVSFGFLEPLESTGLSLTQVQILDLERTISDGATALARKHFNDRCAKMFDTTRDFVMAHFVLTKRSDTPYWRHIRYDNDISDTLADLLYLARYHRSFAGVDADRDKFYDKLNWNVVLSGMGYFKGDPTPSLKQDLTSDLPSHLSALTEIHQPEMEGAETAMYEPELEGFNAETAHAGDFTHPMWGPTF